LTRDQIERFHREGYLVVRDLLDDADLQPVIDELDAEVNRRAREFVEEGELAETHKEKGFTRQLAAISAETDQLALGIWDGSLHGPAIFNLIRNDKLLDVAESLCGEELIASSVYRVRPKIPSHIKSPVPWHQDSGYFEPYCDKNLVLTMWIPLVDATEENGCLWVIPGAHQGEVVRHVSRVDKPYLEILEADLPGGDRVCAEVPKGGVLLLTNRTPHASFENNSDHVRWSMDLRYQNAALPTNAAISREPEESVPDEAHGVPPACYPPEADFLVRSRKRPDEVVTDPAVFHEIREQHVHSPVTPRWRPAT